MRLDIQEQKEMQVVPSFLSEAQHAAASSSFSETPLWQLSSPSESGSQAQAQVMAFEYIEEKVNGPSLFHLSPLFPIFH